MVDGEQGIARYCKGLISRGDNPVSLGLYPYVKLAHSDSHSNPLSVEKFTYTSFSMRVAWVASSR